MPFTPFIGLSVLIHLCVIAAGKISSWFSYRKNIHKPISNKKPGFSTHLASISVMVAVFVFVISTAFIQVRASIFDKHSSVIFVSAYVEKEFAAATPMGVSASVASTTPIVLSSAITPSACLGPFTLLSSEYGDSLVNYLESKKIDFSFSAREKLAKSFGISQYDGDYKQNQVILASLFAQFDELPALDSATCQNQ